MAQAIKIALRNGMLLLLLGPALCLTGCNDHHTCEEKYVFVPFSEAYKSWFNHAGPNNYAVYKKARSSSGLEESVGVSKLIHSEAIKGPYRPCFYESGEATAISYGSTLYNNQIGITLLQQSNGEEPVLRLRVEERSAAINDRITLQFQIGSPRQFPVTIARYRFEQNYTENIDTGTFPEVQLVDSLVAAGRVYRQVYKISNPNSKANGSPFSLTDFYIDKDFGLVQYDQKDGTKWQIFY